MTKTTIPCPKCGGTGLVTAFMPVTRLAKKVNVKRKVVCQNCNGLGVITTETPDFAPKTLKELKSIANSKERGL